MPSIDCPACDYEHDIGRFSDWYEHLPRSGGNVMTWECVECGLEFDVTVDWEPSFWSHEDTLRCNWHRNIERRSLPLTQAKGGGDA